MTAWTDKKFSTLAGYMSKTKLSNLFSIVNMWNYYKPTDGTTYGVSPTSISLSNLTSVYNSAWTRNAVAASHKKLSKFESYNHSMSAPVSSFLVTGSPYTSNAGGNSVTFTADINLATITTARVDLSDVVGSGFYFAVRCIGPETHTEKCSATLANGGKQITFNTSGWTAGSYTCYPFITNSDYSVCYSMPNVSCDTITVTQYVAPAPTVTGIVVTGYNGAVDFGGSFTLAVYLTYSNGTTGTTNYAASASYSGYDTYFNRSGGTFTGKAVGSCDITVTYMGYSATVHSATVSKSLQSISISGYSAIRVGESFTLAVTAHYSDGSTATVTSGLTWSGYSTSVVTRSGNKFTGAGVGSTTITASYGGKTAAQSVSVSAAQVNASTVTANPQTASISVGDIFTPTGFSVYPNDGLYSNPVWSIYSGRATLMNSSTGMIKATAAGTVKLRITLTVGSTTIHDDCTVTITSGSGGADY